MAKGMMRKAMMKKKPAKMVEKKVAKDDGMKGGKSAIMKRLEGRDL